MGNYHPVTMLSYAIEYKIFGLSASGYHTTNWLLHLINTTMVFILIQLLTKSVTISLLTTLLFGIHPMHVESVAWISERKGLLYTFFYLLSIYYYLKYVQSGNKMRFYLLMLMAFVLSLLSKGLAVTLPVIFLLFDLYLRRKLNAQVWLEKLPFFILSIIFGIVAIKAQSAYGYIQDSVHYDFISRIFYGSYAIIMYVWKLFIPLKLSAFYPYPDLGKSMSSIIVYSAPVLLAIILAFLVKSRKNNRVIWFGIAFFIITIALVLQFIPVGKAVISNRYTYISYLGPFLIISHGIKHLLDSKRYMKMMIVSSLCVIFLALGMISYERCTVWQTSGTVWTDVINKYPKVALAYYNRGTYYNEIKDYKRALLDFNKSIELDVTNYSFYNNRGSIYFLLDQYEKAVADFTECVALKANHKECLYNRSISFYKLKQFNRAFKDANRAEQLGKAVSATYKKELEKNIKKRGL